VNDYSLYVLFCLEHKKEPKKVSRSNNASTRMLSHHPACLCRIRQLAEQAGCSTGPTLKINFKDEAGASELGDPSLGIFLNTITTQLSFLH
jgi:hypothetical protein